VFVSAAAAFIFLLLAGCRSPGPAGEPADRGREEEPSGGQRAVEASPAGDPAPAVRRTYVVLGGDVMLQEQIHDIARERGDGDLAAGYTWFLEPLAGILDELERRGTVAFVVNLESPVAEERVEPRSFPPVFNGPPEALEGLATAGVDGVTVANNHALDQRRSGLMETVRAARAAQLQVAGGGEDPRAARAPMVLGDDPRVALLSFFHRPGGGAQPDGAPVLALLDEGAPHAVREARAEHDAVIVTVHWVGEFVSEPREPWVRWARALVAAGADAVICHGPHVPGPVEVVRLPGGRQAPVAYSLGNLLSNMGWEVYPGRPVRRGRTSAQRPETREQVLAVLEVTADADAQPLTGFALVPVFLMDNRYAAFRPGGGPRLIYPLALPGCRLPDPFPCFPASRPAECRALEEMVATGCRHTRKTLWERRPLLVDLAR
jgi:poly-gamma-glutamate synthesis protein (capsule biosynthesis protein)